MMLLWFLCLLWVLSVADRCKFNYNTHKVPSVLDSLTCYNNYKSYFYCTWREPKHNSTRRLQVFFHKDKTHECDDYHSDEDGFRACRFYTKVFSPGTNYIVFFDYPHPPKLCPSIRPISHDLSVLLRTPSPVTLTTSSPYPQSSALSKDMAYQVDGRSPGRNDRTVEESNMQKRLAEGKRIEGHYKARARARRLPQKNYNCRPPSVTDPEQAPRLDCVRQEVQGKLETRCSWEQSIELGYFISYQLVCHHNHTATPKECCKDLKAEHMKDTVKFSCRIALTPSSTLELVPKHNAKLLNSKDTFHPDPPTGVTVTKKGQLYVVNWIPPETSEIKDFTLDYEVRNYYSQENKEHAKPIGSRCCSANIKASSLQPSRKYWVQVRSVVENTRSKWSSPEEWTPDAATWQNWIYASVALVVSALFIRLLVVPVCRRRVVLWVESVPSPDKSKAVLDIKTVKYPQLMVSEETYRCKVMDMDSVSTCYSVTSLWPDKRMDSQMEDTEDEGIWSCDNLPISPLDKSSLSFSGPYILCPIVESKPKEKPAEVSWPVVGCPVAMMIAQSEEGYVRLPCPAVSASMEHLPSQSYNSTDGRSSRDTEVDTEEDTEAYTEEDTEAYTEEDTEEDQHHLTQDCTFEAFWPQGGAILGSGYCQLPSDFTHRCSQN